VSGADLAQEARDLVAGGVARIGDAPSTDEVKAVESELLGKRSRLSELKAGMRDLSPEDRKVLGAALNETRATLEAAVVGRIGELAAQERRVQLAAERLDLTEHLGRADAGPTVRRSSEEPIA